MMIYKIFRGPEWQQLERDGSTSGAPVDLADGYIHFSTAETLRGTLEKHFAGEDGLSLLACDAEMLGSELRWEPSRGGVLFPHLYRALRRNEVIWQRPLPLGPDGHEIGELA
ncbi:Uncharacterized conserved protein, DUF952 family [Paracoccus isoporae]|uniref:Uncharacterized conserved protein, DUF952 family n=1 Tax=Paracoccus isoporae TaxID=591205 RepID=A0A1G6XYY6_9RHOB|nr:DUF952 domain-containing protein [Paracoccus isoporae]SDD83252.1 Uncharacterized conserved protein, DUF952 family [Paracoccus isoporae]